VRAQRLVVAATVAVLTVLTASPVRAADPWWQRVGFAGAAVSRLSAGGGQVAAEVGSERQVSTDGINFHVQAGGVAAPPPAVQAGEDTWSIVEGRVRHARGGGGAALDPGSPDLGKGATLIASPLALPGTVVAISEGGSVWRRKAGGDWAQSLLLLPAGLWHGVPEITGVAAFADRPVSGVVYISTRGYGTLLTGDGGADWTRADPGLPGEVLSLASDGSVSPPLIWAGTTDGLWVHRLQRPPEIPVYQKQDLMTRTLTTVVVVLLASAAAAACLLRFARTS